jgi:hypothetical protein
MLRLLLLIVRRLLEAALIRPSDIIFLATDGILANQPLHHLKDEIEDVLNCSIAHSLARVKDEKQGDTISLGDWEYARRDGGVFVMAGVYVHYIVERDKSGAFILNSDGMPKVETKYIGRLRGADISKYAEGNDGQPWLVSQALKAWRAPYDLDDSTSYPAIESAYQKLITVGSVFTPRYAPMLREGEYVENNRIVIEERFNRGGRWSIKADDPRNNDIRAWNDDIILNTKVRSEFKVSGDKLRLALLEEIVFKRTIHVHDVGLKRVHIKPRGFGYCWSGDKEPLRCLELIESIPAGNYKKDDEGNYIMNWDMSEPRIPDWLNKADGGAVEDMELDAEIKAGILGYDDDGDSERTVDIYADT